MKSKILFAIAFSTLFCACTKTDPNLVKITGKVTNPIEEKVRFDNSIAPFLGDTSYSTILNKEGEFSISFNIDSATFLNFCHGVEVTAMYVKPGDKINLTIDTKLFDETIKYEGSEASSFLAEVYLLKENRDFFGKEYYLSNVEEYKATLDSFKSDVMKKFNGMTDSIFIKDQIDKIDKGISSYTSQQQQNLKQNTEDVRRYMWETRKIARDFNFYTAIDSLNITDFNSMTKQYTKAFESSLTQVTDAEFLITEKERIKKITDSWLKRKTAVDNIPREGEPALDFIYPDMDGNEYSLASFKGNLVYVDVWATWCGPCKAEIPSLQKLEVDYHDKNITFMSVSVDEDKEAWGKMVEEKKLGGVQLWADGWSQITKDYAIFGIPRFMLLDANGNVISTNAPRPSSDDIRELIEANL